MLASWRHLDYRQNEFSYCPTSCFLLLTLLLPAMPDWTRCGRVCLMQSNLGDINHCIAAKQYGLVHSSQPSSHCLSIPENLTPSSQPCYPKHPTPHPHPSRRSATSSHPTPYNLQRIQPYLRIRPRPRPRPRAEPMEPHLWRGVCAGVARWTSGDVGLGIR